MNSFYKRLFALIGILSAINFYLPPPVEADSHASSQATLVLRGRRGAWRRAYRAQMKQARKEEKARQKEHQRFEQDHKSRYQKESQDRAMRMSGNQSKIRTYKWKKQN